MRRRDLIAAGTVLAVSATAAAAAPSSDAPPAAATLNLVPLGLPVVSDGRLRNYVFVNLRLHLASGQTAEAVRPHDPSSATPWSKPLTGWTSRPPETGLF
ncbi:hypothetical protein [Brevundimonas abyssalis]|uniref:Uncharacterized protein n=1 Tax=Brevundimonas abyssalis TAR-001 TaxID=1391729 RepID=A0A8E0KL47_9CAUL|nr:hypothetical protein [Brevundimonas abyssalis]GAD59300.1 hypothetical protein MBEBAB_1550 [Brevundimonas abyssalis TAR-001]